MNALQHTPAARLADLSPFSITLEPRECLARVRDAVGDESAQRVAKRDSGYGCVDWYQYPVIEQLRPEQQRTRG